MSHSLPPHGIYIPWILQARILEWVAFPFSRGSSQPRNGTRVSCIAGRFFINWAVRETQIFKGKWRISWTEEPSGLQSMGLLRVGHDWSNLARTQKSYQHGSWVRDSKFTYWPYHLQNLWTSVSSSVKYACTHTSQYAYDSKNQDMSASSILFFLF